MAHDARRNPIVIRSMSYASTRRPRLGVVLHFLCTGISLFHMDIDDNVLKGGPEEARLRAWQGIKAESLHYDISWAGMLAVCIYIIFIYCMY